VGTAPWACGTSDAAMPLLDARPFCFPIKVDPSSRPLSPHRHGEPATPLPPPHESAEDDDGSKTRAHRGD